MRWNIKKIGACHLAAFLLIASFLTPFTKHYWDLLDIWFFKALNGTLPGHPLWQNFWAVANHSFIDWLGDVVMLAFFCIYIFSAPRRQRKERVYNALFGMLYIAALIYFVNRVLFREHLQILRSSPTLVIEGAFRLSDAVDWLSIKDSSSKSFPGDHATTALAFASVYTFFAGWKWGIWGWVWAILVTLPRLVVGAHWLSDVVIGSGSIILLTFSWVFYSPLLKSRRKLYRG